MSLFCSLLMRVKFRGGIQAESIIKEAEPRGDLALYCSCQKFIYVSKRKKGLIIKGPFYATLAVSVFKTSTDKTSEEL